MPSGWEKCSRSIPLSGFNEDSIKLSTLEKKQAQSPRSVTMIKLPIDDILPELCVSLEHTHNAVVQAAPGAGKTTRIPLRLLDTPWRKGGKIIMLELQHDNLTTLSPGRIQKSQRNPRGFPRAWCGLYNGVVRVFKAYTEFRQYVVDWQLDHGYGSWRLSLFFFKRRQLNRVFVKATERY